MRSVSELAVDVLAGQVIVGGFEGPELTSTIRERLAAGFVGGVTLFGRNVADHRQVHALTSAIAASAPPDLPPVIAVDQEGGRVARLGPPVLKLPPMRVIGRAGHVQFTERCGRALGSELGALGFNLDFAPVCDVDSNPNNPVIGDRSFGDDPRSVGRQAAAFLRGLQAGGVMACAKHFPGHGDTSVDSHLELPVVEHERERLDRIELQPFRSAIAAGVASVMTAHVLCRRIDPELPATLSGRVLGILKSELKFKGVTISDDLNMKAIGLNIGDAAVAAILAGCDAILVCRHEDRQEEARRAIAREAQRSEAFLGRLREAADRILSLRRTAPPRPVPAADLDGAFETPDRTIVERTLQALGG